MKRRKAIQNITVVSAGVILLSRCDIGIEGHDYSNIPLESSQKKFIRQFINALLPKENLQIETPESTDHFVLTMVNDCHSTEDIQKFISGFNELQLYLNQNYHSNFDKIETEKQLEVFEYLEDATEQSDYLEFFYKTAKRYTIQHFTSSDFFMTNYMDYEMAPGRFLGCVKIDL